MAALYLLRGVLVVLGLGLTFPFFLTTAVGLFLLPVALLLRQPRRWFPTAMLVLSVLGLVVNPVMMYINRSRETVAILLISLTITGIWAVLFGLFCTPASRSAITTPSQ